MSAYRIIEGDLRDRLGDLEAGSVQTCVTSPPYWGLRDYGDDEQLGLEPTPERYVENLVSVFREVKRVLRADGTLWLNLGDSYAGSWGNQGRKPERGTQRPINAGMLTPVHDDRYPSKETNTGAVPPGLKSKDLVGIPWMVAFALRADGWYLRSDIIWSKPNPMPESVTDRPTKAHEYLFLLTKSPRYYYDADAIREVTLYPITADAPASGSYSDKSGRMDGGEHRSGGFVNGGGRNKRSVWTVTTQPFPGAHFATFPPKLIEPCILAGSPPKCCGECGAPSERIVKRKPLVLKEPEVPITERRGDAVNDKRTALSGTQVEPASVETLGWRSTCAHSDDSGQALVLDPFAGSGTTGVVALRHDRDFVGIELNPEYVRMARNRIYDDGPLLNVEATNKRRTECSS